MSLNIFANKNIALGFAGLVVVLAVAAPMATELLVPSDGSEFDTGADAETAPQVAAKAPEQPEPTWSDEPLADDWNTGSVASANGNAGWAGGSKSNSEIDQTFSDFSPTRGGSGTSFAPPERTRKVAGQGTVTSTAAKNAPSVAGPPGGSSESAVTIAN